MFTSKCDIKNMATSERVLMNYIVLMDYYHKVIIYLSIYHYYHKVFAGMQRCIFLNLNIFGARGHNTAPDSYAPVNNVFIHHCFNNVDQY